MGWIIHIIATVVFIAMSGAHGKNKILFILAVILLISLLLRLVIKIVIGIVAFFMFIKDSIKDSADAKKIFSSIDANDKESIQQLLARGTSINISNSYGLTPLLYAMKNGKDDIVNFLLEKGADKDRALIDACKQDSEDISSVKFLLSKGADIVVDYNNKSAIDYAKERDYTVTLLLLYEAKAKKTPLIAECMREDRTIPQVESIIAEGVDVNAKDEKGVTALIVLGFSISNNTEDIRMANDNVISAIAKLLIKNGADVNAKDNGGTTALMNACLGGWTCMVKTLIDAGADVNSKDKEGYTPLMCAVQQGYSTIVSLLIENGADVNAKNNVSASVLGFAFHNGYDDIANLLMQNGAKTYM